MADYMTSEIVGIRLWISATRLIELYKVDPAECRIAVKESPWIKDYPWAKILRPQNSGIYDVKLLPTIL